MAKKILFVLKKNPNGITLDRLSRELSITRREKAQFKRKLQELEDKGKIYRIKRRYFLWPETHLQPGRLIQVHRGYGFVRPEGGAQGDIFVPARYAGEAVRGDRVEVAWEEKGHQGRLQGKIVRILDQGQSTLVGVYKSLWGQPYFLPYDALSDKEIPIICPSEISIHPGEIIEVDRKTRIVAKVIGTPDESGIDIDIIIQRYGLFSSFSEAALEEAENLDRSLTASEISSREDFRDWTSVTIDGKDARDFDDAVSIKKLTEDHILLGVHIADVSFWVSPDSAIDQEAYARGTSVYFPDKTLPMLPERLSHDLCSLKPDEDRLTFSVLLEFDGKGKVIRADFKPSIIRSAARLTYDTVWQILQNQERVKRAHSRIVPDLRLMQDLAAKLRKRRVKAGSLDFAYPEPHLRYSRGQLVGVETFEANEAHHLIEEFMIAANEAVATHLVKNQAACLFRVHPPPSLQDLTALKGILFHFGFSLPMPQKIRSTDLQMVQDHVRGKPDARFISLLILKSLKLAVYSDKNLGHYGLGLSMYAHFTSPIRRYPDLVVHRLLKDVLRGKGSDTSSLAIQAVHVSDRERQAEEAERELKEWRIYRLLHAKIGDEVWGFVVDITKAGLLVELEDYFVSGIIFYNDLGGDHFYRKTEATVEGKRSGRMISMGERMKVILAAVDPELRRMTLVPSPQDI